MTTIKKIIDYFNNKGNKLILGNKKYWEIEIYRPMSLKLADENNLTFVNLNYLSDYFEISKNSKCRIIIVDEKTINKENINLFNSNVTYVLSNNPKKDLIDVCTKFFSSNEENETLIHKTAMIHNNSSVGVNSYIGPNVVIEKNVIIGDNCEIQAGSIIKSNTVIGNNVIIGSCNVIGGIGFGYVFNEEKDEYETFPHFGGVVIKNKVHIGNNVCIDKGSLNDTIIEEGVKIDNLVHIAHNVEIGKNSVIIACSMIAGSVKIGKKCWVAPSASIRNGISIGDNSTIGISSTVVKSIDENKIVLGSPAIELDDFIISRKIQSNFILDYKKNIINDNQD